MLYSLIKNLRVKNPGQTNFGFMISEETFVLRLKIKCSRKKILRISRNVITPRIRFERKESERFKSFTYEEISKRDKFNLDIFWLKDESLEGSDNLPAPEIIAGEIIENLGSALEQFGQIQESLKVK